MADWRGGIHGARRSVARSGARCASHWGSWLDLNAEPEETAGEIGGRHRDGIPERDLGRCAGWKRGDDGPCREIVACLNDITEVACGGEAGEGQSEVTVSAVDVGRAERALPVAGLSPIAPGDR